MYNHQRIMSDTVAIDAYCKINLHLRVLARRADGFHDIESVFQLISLADKLSVSISGPDQSCLVVSPRMELPAVNTITKAVTAFRSLTGVTAGIRVEVDKRIPAGAGLGGGSADAAAILRALERLFGLRVPQTRLVEAAAGIGSDVPFFLEAAAATVAGRGERISPIVPRTDLYGVLIWPGIGSSTADAYRLVDDSHARGEDANTVWTPFQALEAMYSGPVTGWIFGNSFTAPVESVCPPIREAEADLRACGADFCAMSGSGSTVFALFGDERVANEAFSRLSAKWLVCHTFLLLASSEMQ
jgi:4-diphosphocytidyl-2-C-methyl-D-erythritol kinase